jgi:hypothetical protein
MEDPVNTFPSPRDVQAKLRRMLRDAGFKESELVQVASSPVGGHARYVVTVLSEKATFPLADAVERIIHRPLLGAHWVLYLEEARAITAG